MALVRTSTIISDIRGSVGGVVFQSNSAGLILRNKTQACNRNSHSQNIQRNIIYNVQQQWLGLSSSQKSSYSSLVQLAQVKQRNIIGRLINGQQLFIKVNSLLSRYNVNIITNTYLSSFNPDSFGLTMREIGGQLYLYISRNLVISSELLVLKMSNPISSSLYNDSGKLRLIVFGQLTNNNWNITESVISVFGKVPTSGSTIFIESFLVGKRIALLGSKIKSKLTIG